ncbi:CRISPR system precrRNA processing endoribonuclease RAMP protein Cas6 [bacterium]|nr:MAG: CRISPR system precrRNA processing endoribonuclease RAMP protein Cas6 [bacterium]
MIYSKLNVEINLDDKRIQDWNYSSAMRGIFGRTLKQIYCIQRNILCDNCSFDHCFYYELFEKKYGSYRKFHPYIINDITPVDYLDRLLIQFMFIGKICNQLPQLIHGLLRIQKYALIAAKYSYNMQINTIKNQDGILTYDKKIGKIDLPNLCEIGIEKRSAKKLKIHIETPFRVKYRNQFLRKFIWHAFIHSLYERLKYINNYFCASDLKLHLLRKNYDIQVITDNTTWKEQYRKSHIQKQKMSFGGLVGDIIIENVDEDTYALLKLGELFHVGKQTTFGLGKYKLEIIENNEECIYDN